MTKDQKQRIVANYFGEALSTEDLLNTPESELDSLIAQIQKQSEITPRKATEKKSVPGRIFDELTDLICTLLDRWECEKEFEDLSDYGEVIEKALKKYGANFIMMLCDPFGYVYSYRGYRFKVTLTVDGEYAYQKV